MTSNTINDAMTIAGGDSAGAMLAGRYRIVRQLGQGGMGSVWLAEDTQLDNKPFAIKMLPSILVSNKRAYRQLKDEALVAMKLTHPNIVTLRAFEENNGNPFLVMDYIDGETLDDYLCERGPGNGERGSSLSEEETIRVLRPIAAALDYAHGEGVVHRDVKPANVMIRKDGHPFILDFGIAREIQETLTRVTGKLSSGTLLYMSPEQLNGEMPKPAQDIYSFAAMAYECLKGEPPFVRGAIEDQIKNKVPEPLVGRDDPIAPQSIAASVMAGLAKKPEDRPKSCVAVLSGKDLTQRRREAETQSGGARRPAEPGGSRVPRDRDDAPQSVGRRVPTPPPPVNDSYRVERVRSRTPPRGDDVSRKECKERKGGDIGKVLGILALLAVLGGGGAWYYHQQQETARRERARSVVERNAQEERALKATKAEATQIRIKAIVQQGEVDSISDDDGFKARKGALADAFARAEALFDENTKRWSEAAQGFSNHVAQCKTLIALDGERRTAAGKRAEAVNAKSRAEETEAEKYASARWGEAVKLLASANGEFGRMDFASAKGTFGSAARQFMRCADEAKAERERQEVAAKVEHERAEAAAKEKAEREARARTAHQMAGEQRQEKIERLRRRLYPEYYAKKDMHNEDGKNHDKVQLWEGGPYWATTNIGAERPWECGYYFWWGDTLGYKRVGDAWVASDGSSQNFSFGAANTPTYGKTCDDLKREGWITEDGVLASVHDAAHRHWGGSWRMPTKQELDDLKNKCDWTWTTRNRVNGYVVRGRGTYTSYSIFLPCAGYGYGTSLSNAGSYGLYWSSVPSSDYSYYGYAWDLDFYSSDHSTSSDYYRYSGRSVRPVQGFTK